jgi:AcrR family transcriptional regulator
MTAAPTLRDRKRQQTRERIEEAALRLFGRDGFDQVTVEDVCREAGVGPATFYRHFGTKEAVVFAYREEFTAAIGAAVAAAADRPREQQLPHVVTSFAGYLESQRELLAQRDDIVLGHPALLRSTLAVQRDMEAELAAGLARLRGLAQPDRLVALEAAVGMVVLRTALRTWRTGAGRSLPEAAEQALTDLRTLLGRDGG